jgi:hypothetical protein
MSSFNNFDDDEDLVDDYYIVYDESKFEFSSTNNTTHISKQNDTINNGKKRVVILTTPHSGPDIPYKNNIHSQDYFAKEATNILASYIMNKKMELKIFTNTNVPRKNCDLNRDIGKNCGFRIELTDYLAMNRDNVQLDHILLDIHSFPLRHHNNQSHDRYIYENDFYILLDKNNSPSYYRAKELARRIIDYHKQPSYDETINVRINRINDGHNGVNTDNYILCDLYTGINNSIMSESLSNNIPSILIEFNEMLIYDTVNSKNKMNRICESIINAINALS